METTDKEIQALEQLYALRKQAARLRNKPMVVMQTVAATDSVGRVIGTQ